MGKTPATPLRKQALKGTSAAASTSRLLQYRMSPKEHRQMAWACTECLDPQDALAREQTRKAQDAQAAMSLYMPMPSADVLLATYDIEAQRQLLRSHYCRSEFRFLVVRCAPHWHTNFCWQVMIQTRQFSTKGAVPSGLWNDKQAIADIPRGRRRDTWGTVIGYTAGQAPKAEGTCSPPRYHNLF
jgi:hypothetical protein